MTFARKFTEWKERRAAESEANRQVLCTPSRALHRGTYSGTYSGTTTANPKPLEHRNPTLLAMAKDRPCLLLIPGICNHRVDTTVAAHSNLSIHGKAGARKADDQYSVWACHACHFWLDTSKAAAAHKEMAFTLGHVRQVLAWRLVAMDPMEPRRFQAAARWALGLLKATTIGEKA
jgi:hypothetical protein